MSEEPLKTVCSSESDMADRVRGALYGMFIADALAMPTHWYYGGSDQVRRAYGKIKGYVKPQTKLPGSIMSKSNTGGGGRGSFKGDIIGDVIFHGKKKFWARGADYHYHHALEKGGNTLEILLTRRVLATIASTKGTFVPKSIVDDYVQFMMTPDTHNDTYCGTCHRMFFANMKSGIPLGECPDNDNHNVDNSDSIITTVPIALMSADDEKTNADVATMVALTRRSIPSQQYAVLFASLLRDVVIRNVDVRSAVEKNADAVGFNVKAAARRQDPVTA